MNYQHQIKEDLARMGRLDLVASAKRAEELIRLQYRTLDHLSAADWRREMRIAVECIDMEAGL